MKQGELLDVKYLFKNEHPEQMNVNDLIVFANPKSELPRPMKHNDTIIIDYELDSDLIYSAFLGQYGIDLVDIKELHYHKFLALLKGLNESTVLNKIMGYRALVSCAAICRALNATMLCKIAR